MNIKLNRDDPAAESLATSTLTDTETGKGSRAVGDEQGIRAFLFNLLNS